MLRKSGSQRKEEENLMLGGSTAFVAGMVNVVSVIAFFAFSSNVTGHWTILTEELIKGHWYQVFVVFGWLFLFFFGAFLSNFLVNYIKKYSTLLAHSIPISLELVILVIIGYYGHNHYVESLEETVILVAGLIFSMGLQNGLVATISNGLVKTTHLTGLTTDLGIGISMYTKSENRKDKKLLERLRLHIAILVFYFAGGFFGGLIFGYIGFQVYYIIASVLGLVLYMDLRIILKYKLLRKTALYARRHNIKTREQALQDSIIA